MKIVFLDAATLGDDLSFEMFESLGEVLKFQTTAENEFQAHAAQADVIVVNKVKIGEKELISAPNLKLICIAATGFDNIDIKACKQRGVGVCNVVGYSTNCVAQLTLSMVLSLYTHLPEYSHFVQSGEYTRRGIANRLSPTYHEIAGKTWGIVGFGNIGKQVGKIAKALGCRILVHKKTPITDWECVDFETICQQSDILSFHVPLNEKTRGMLDARHIQMLKKDAIVINVARGAVIDEEAIANAILQDKIGGIGIDVYTTEPIPEEHPFQVIKDKPNVCLTPHMAWGGYETRMRLLTDIAENIKAFYNGENRCRLDS